MDSPSASDSDHSAKGLDSDLDKVPDLVQLEDEEEEGASQSSSEAAPYNYFRHGLLPNQFEPTCPAPLSSGNAGSSATQNSIEEPLQLDLKPMMKEENERG